MQTATKRGSPPRVRGGEPRRIFLGEARRAPRRGRPGALAYGGGQGPPLLPRGLPGRCRTGEKGARCGTGKKAGRCRTGEKGARCGTGKKPAGARCGAGEKAGRCGTGKKAGRCGAGGKGQVRHGKKGRQVPHGGKRVRGAALGKKPAGAARVPAGPLSPGRKCRRGLPGRRRPPRGSRGGREKRERGGFPFFPALGVPGQCAGDADGAGAAGPRDVRRGQSRRCGVSPKRDAPKGHRAAKKGGRRGRKSAPGALPFSLCGPFGAAAHVFGTFCGALPTHKSIGRVRTRRRCRRRDFAGRPPRCRPRGRWSGGCRQRGARPPR